MRRPIPAFEVAAVFAAAFFLGLTIVAFPASALHLKQTTGITEGELAWMFLGFPAGTVVGAIFGKPPLVAALSVRSAGSLSASLLHTFALIGIAAVALALASQSNGVTTIALLAFGNAAAGVAFGLSAGPLNSHPAKRFPDSPKRRQSALVVLHLLQGLGFVVGPGAVSLLAPAGLWLLYPIALMLAATGFGIALQLKPLAPDTEQSASSKAASLELSETISTSSSPLPYIALIVLYAVTEGVFANWAGLYLHEARGVDQSQANWAISVFWLGIIGGRLLTSALLRFANVKSEQLWAALALVMAMALLALPYAEGLHSGLLLFALAGLASSAFLPLTIDAGESSGATHAGVLIVALACGVGGGSALLALLSEHFAFEQLYRSAALLPLVAVGLILGLHRTPRPVPAE